MRPARALAAALALACGPAGASPRVQVGIVQHAGGAVLRPEGPFSAVGARGAPLELAERDYTLSPADGGVLLGSSFFPGELRLKPSGRAGLVRVNGQSYRGELIVRRGRDGTLTIVDELGLEEYLYGVLPAEMSPEWPLEALKAQAVVARSFALSNLGKFQGDGFDLSADSRSQAYGDAGRETARALEAVHATEGEVLYWKGRPLKVYFHACCGGHTADVSAIWGSPGVTEKPLRGVPDRWCRASPHYEWKAYFSADDILSALQRHRLPFARLKGLRLGRVDRSGYACTLRVYADRTSAELRANDLRNWLGNTDFKSTQIRRVQRLRRGFAFAGRGFGHGVGLCQWGARAMAERGRDYREILRYYFPGAEIARHEG